MANKIYCLSLVLAVVATLGPSLASRCKKHISRGYQDNHYYRLDDKDLRYMKMTPNGDLEMHLFIQGPSDGHIILSPTLNPANKTDPAYEIQFGSYMNALTELRSSRHGPQIAATVTHDILSPSELRSFYVKISKDGVIEVGKEGSSPLIRYLDKHLLDIKYFGFSSWDNHEVIFLYDCPRPGSEAEQETLNTTGVSADQSVFCETSSVVDSNDKSENELTFKISGLGASKTYFARLDLNVYGGTDRDVPVNGKPNWPLPGAVNRSPYPYSDSKGSQSVMVST